MLIVETAELNPQQKEAVETTEGPLLILAGAGSGKTRVITCRTAYMALNKRIPQERILALTFTNKAAAEMRDRTCELMQTDTIRMWISTFHSACVRILRRDINKLGFTRDFVIYDAADSLKLLKQCIKTLEIPNDDQLKPKSVAYTISNLKNNMVLPSEYDAGDDFRERYVKEIYTHYQSLLKQNNALDFDDLLMMTVMLFESHEEALKYYSERFTYVMVDEYQDTNRTQYQILKLLTSGHGNLCVVGDDDQSIYQWRGATVRNILEFEKDYPNTKVVRLEENYRSTQLILNAAWEVVSKVQNRREKKLWTKKQGGEKITIHTAPNEMEEASFISRTITSLHKKRSIPYREMAVFYRTNAQSRVIEDYLRRAKIPYRIFGGLKFYDRMEIKDILAYLRVTINPSDSINLKRIINTPARGVGAVTLRKIEDYSLQEGLTLLEGVRIFAETKGKGLRAFVQIIDKLSEAAAQRASDVIRLAIEITGYEKALLGENTPESRNRLENLKELVTGAVEYEATYYDNKTVAGFLDRTALFSGSDELTDSSGSISMMTYHLSKGLEFGAVFMSGMEDNIFPHIRSAGNQSELDEERRLCYVGMTRAKERLYMTKARIRTIFGREQRNFASEFLEDIPSDFVTATGDMGRYVEVSKLRYVRPEKNFRKPAGAVAKSGASKEKFRIGSKVTHPEFGEGLILQREGCDDNVKLTIFFKGGAGKKKIATKYVLLQVP